LKQHTPGFLKRHLRQAPPHVQGVLAKLSLCRTAALGGRVYACSQCEHRCCVYNSCGDRHCPQCQGARRSDWLDKTAELLLPKINYFQVVFTLPAEFSRLTLGNRRPLYDLLMRAAWRALRDVLSEELGIQPAALLVLHTWNQELEHHPHVHALVPGGGPSLDGDQWIASRHPTGLRRSKPYLVDNRLLSEKFKQKFSTGMKRLHRAGKLQFGPLSVIEDYPDFVSWLDQIAAKDWNVFIEPPPLGSAPAHILKYLARYLSGGPISDRRLLSHEEGQVTFWARSKNKQTGNKPRPFTLPGVEFVRRWSLHILPKGFTKVRTYGGFSTRHRESYLERSRTLLKITAAEEPDEQCGDDLREETEESSPTCPHCQCELVCLQSSKRPGWRDLFADYATCPWWYPAAGNRQPARHLYPAEP
jgi:hypothetical protein